MREYLLYYCDTAEAKPRYTSEIHAQAIANTYATDFYRNKDVFFKKYLFESEKKKLYNQLLKKFLHKNDDILSIGSGRCIDELYLIDKGYKITCSDVGDLAAKDATKTLFPMFEYEKINILLQPSNTQCDIVFLMGVAYLFDNKELSCFFENAYRSLRKDGRLILDGAEPGETLRSILFYDVFLPIEVCLKSLILTMVRKKRVYIRKKHHGFRRSDEEIIEIAKSHGFEFVSKEIFKYSGELKSSIINLLRKCNILNKLIDRIRIPSIRIFQFDKTSET